MNIIRSLQRKTECPFFYDYKTVQQALRFMRSLCCVKVPVVISTGGISAKSAKVISYGISSTGAAMRRQRITNLPSCCAAARRRP